MLYADYRYDHIEIDQCLEWASPNSDIWETRGKPKVTGQKPHRPDNRPIATSIDGDPSESVGYIFPIGNKEFHVPHTATLPGGFETDGIDTRVENAELVVRPNGTRQLSEMTRSRDISPDDRKSLKLTVADWESSEPVAAKEPRP